MMRVLNLLLAAAMFVPMTPIVAAQRAKPSNRGQTANPSEQQRKCRLEVDGKIRWQVAAGSIQWEPATTP